MRPILSSPKSPLSAYFGAQLVHRIQVRLVSPGAQQAALRRVALRSREAPARKPSSARPEDPFRQGGN